MNPRGYGTKRRNIANEKSSSHAVANFGNRSSSVVINRDTVQLALDKITSQVVDLVAQKNNAGKSDKEIY